MAPVKSGAWREGVTAGPPIATRSWWTRRVPLDVEYTVYALLDQFAMVEVFGFPNGQPWGRQPWYLMALYRAYRQAEAENGA